MNSINRFAKVIHLLILISLLLWAPTLWAKEADLVLQYSAQRDTAASGDVLYDFDDTRIAGFERKNIAKDLRIRGWKISDGLYLGQAKVADKWGLGAVYERGDMVYGINHRGIQVMKRF